MKKEISKSHTIKFKLTQGEIKECIEKEIKERYQHQHDLGGFEYSCNLVNSFNHEIIAHVVFKKELE